MTGFLARWSAAVLLGLAVASCTRSPHDPTEVTPSADGTPPGAVPSGALPSLARASWKERDDPSSDGWDSEVAAGEIGARLGRVARALSEAGEVDHDDASLRPLAADDFVAGAFEPAGLRTVRESGLFRVERGAAARPDGTDDATPVHRGREGFIAWVGSLRAAAGSGSVRAAFKLTEVRPTADGAAVISPVALVGGEAEVHATLVMTWRRQGSEHFLTAIATEDFERTTRRSARPLFEDVAPAVIGANPSFSTQLLHGLGEWLGRVQDHRFFALLGTPGIAVADVDGDGLDDLYLCQEGGLPNRLFIQSPDGTARDVSAGSGVDWLESSRAALLLDFDGDGHRDLAVTTIGCLAFAAGDGTGRFSLRAALPTSRDTMSLSAVDYDGDGDLDVYVCAYKRDDLSRDAGPTSIGASDAFVYHDANDAAPNLLFRNDIAATGDAWTFTDVTAEVGLDVNNRRYSFAAAWEDLDNDGDQDLYVANDFGENCLYLADGAANGAANGTRFREVAEALGAEDRASGMSVSFGRYDDDERPDIYVGNMFSSAGLRVTALDHFKPEAPDVREKLRRFARGNTLLRGTADGYEDVSEAAGVTLGRWAWSSNFVDFDLDGRDDIVVANGYITTDDTGDL